MSKLFLTKEQMEKLTTKRLLAYKKSLMKYPEGPNWEEGCSVRMNKSEPKWIKAYNNCKEILKTREHIEK